MYSSKSHKKPTALSTSAATVKSEHLIKSNLDIGSMVEISRENCENIYGVIRWIGYIPSTKILSVGVELEDEQPNQTNDDGAINGVQLFTCPPGRALFVQPEQCTFDRRFQDVQPPSTLSQKSYESERKAAENFGHIECPIVEGAVPPLSKYILHWLLILIRKLNFNVCRSFFLNRNC